jgi:hypothetical protein
MVKFPHIEQLGLDNVNSAIRAAWDIANIIVLQRVLPVSAVRISIATNDFPFTDELTLRMMQVARPG